MYAIATTKNQKNADYFGEIVGKWERPQCEGFLCETLCPLWLELLNLNYPRLRSGQAPDTEFSQRMLSILIPSWNYPAVHSVCDGKRLVLLDEPSPGIW